MQELFIKLDNAGHDVCLACFDHEKPTVRALVMENMQHLVWADEVYVVWNERSTGTIFDMGAVAMLHYLCEATADPLRPVVHIVDVEAQTFPQLFIEMAEASGSGEES